MRRVPWWAMLSSSLAPVFLVAGWTVAAAVQPAGYDPVRDTISALAGHGAEHRWIMTAALAGVGVCHLATAAGLGPATARPAGRAGLGPARLAGRIVLAVGGAATLLVAASPLPRTGGSAPHGIAATIAFAALAVWPSLAAGSAPGTPWALRPAVSIVATAVLLALVGWFVVQLSGDGGWIGAAERAAAGAQAVWPLIVVLSSRYARVPSHTW
jgi:hypothetical membrane protein